MALIKMLGGEVSQKMTKLSSTTQVQLLLQVLNKKTLIIDAVRFFYHSAIRDINLIGSLGFELKFQPQYKNIFIQFFGSGPVPSCVIPTDFLGYREFRAMQILNSRAQLTPQQVGAILDSGLVFVHQEIIKSPLDVDGVFPAILSQRHQKHLNNSALENIARQRSDSSSFQLETYFLGEKLESFTETLKNGVTFQYHSHYSTEFQGEHIIVTNLRIPRIGPAVPLKCVIVKQIPVREERPQHPFILAFLRSCLFYKYTELFDVIDYTFIFRQLSSGANKPTFASLREKYTQDPGLFTRILEKYLQQLYQNPDTFTAKQIFTPRQHEVCIEGTKICCFDQISLEPLHNAARGTECQHIQCLNPESIGQRCPICGVGVKLILLDILQQKLINFVQNQNKGRKIRSVEIDNDFFQIINVETAGNGEEESDNWFDEEKQPREEEKETKEDSVVSFSD